MVRPEDVPFKVPADVADDVRRIEVDIDRMLVAQGGVAMKAIDDLTPDRRRVESVRRLYAEAGWDVTVESDPHGDAGGCHFHVHVRKRAPFKAPPQALPPPPVMRSDDGLRDFAGGFGSGGLRGSGF